MEERPNPSREALSTRQVGVRTRRPRKLTFGLLEAELARVFPLEGGESWDRSGLVAGDRDEVITSVAIALDPTPRAVRLAAEQGANLLLTHHPAFLTPPTRFCDDIRDGGIGGAVVWEAARRGVGLMNFHTCLDVSPQAARVLPSLLSLRFTDRFLQPAAERPGCGYGAICAVESSDTLQNLGQLASRCTSVFGVPPKVWGPLRSGVSTIVTAGGSAGFLIERCLNGGVDALVCGEVHYHDALAASEAGLGIIELGHDVSEMPLAVVLTQAVMEAGLPSDTIVALDQPRQWSYPDAVRL